MPTAIAAGNLNIRTKRGVISDPPPTPVKPTNTPTIKPEIIYSIPIDIFCKLRVKYNRISYIILIII